LSGTRPEESFGSYDYGLFEIVDSELQLAGSDKFGAVSAASLLVRGQMLQMQFRYAQSRDGSMYDDGRGYSSARMAVLLVSSTQTSLLRSEI
jgi:hypothetical protein